MSEFRVVEANGDAYPPHAQPCRTLRAAMRRRDFYEQLTVVSGENLRLPVGPLRIERRSMVVSAWEPWNVGAARDTNEPRETTLAVSYRTTSRRRSRRSPASSMPATGRHASRGGWTLSHR